MISREELEAQASKLQVAVSRLALAVENHLPARTAYALVLRTLDVDEAGEGIIVFASNVHDEVFIDTLEATARKVRANDIKLVGPNAYGGETMN